MYMTRENLEQAIFNGIVHDAKMLITDMGDGNEKRKGALDVLIPAIRKQIEKLLKPSPMSVSSSPLMSSSASGKPSMIPMTERYPMTSFIPIETAMTDQSRICLCKSCRKVLPKS